MKKIYLAIPYTYKSDDRVTARIYRVSRFHCANAYAAKFMRQGFVVFSPISHSHTIARDNDLPVDWEFWKAQDEAFVQWSDIVVVVCINGWEQSTGVQAEIKMAEELGKKVVYLDPNGDFEAELKKIQEK